LSHFRAPLETAPGWLAVCRGAALASGALLLMNTVERRVYQISDSATWVCDFAPLDSRMIPGLLALAGTALLLFAVKPAQPQPIRWSVLTIIAILVCFLLAALYRAFTGERLPGQDAMLFQPVSWLTTLTIVAVGLLSPARMLPAAVSSLLTVGVVALITTVGIVVCTVRSGIRNDPSADGDTRTVIVVVADPEAVEERLALALDHYAEAPETVVAILSHDAEQIDQVTEQVTQQAQSRELDPPVVVPVLASTDLTENLLAVADKAAAASQQDDPAAPPSDGENSQSPATPTVFWCGDATHFARVRMTATRHQLSVVCRASHAELALASESQRLAAETLAFGRELFTPLWP